MILVTGAAGVIGRAVMRRLQEDTIDSFGVSRQNFDLASGDSLPGFVPRKPDAIIHLAAAVPHSLRYPDTDASAKLTRIMDWKVFEAASFWGARVIYASGCINYDRKCPAIKTEESSYGILLKGAYANAKRDGEALFATLPSHAILRVSAPIGPGLPSNVVAQVFLDRALVGKPLEVWGSGEREQNFVDTRDIAAAFIMAARAQLVGVFNLTADTPTTMAELAKTTVDVVGGGVVLFSGAPDPQEPEYARFSNAHLRSSLGWEPLFSLRDSLRHAIGDVNEY